MRTSDIWFVSTEELQSLKKQTDSLLKPLEKTAYFAQGVTLQSDIEVALDKIKFNQERAETPEEKLFTYSESVIELKSVKQKIDKLKDISSQVSSTGTMLGFVGATQTLAVWGLIIIMSAGFVFLMIYMRKLSSTPVVVKKVSKTKKKTAKVINVAPQSNKIALNTHLVAFILFYGAAISILSVFATSKVISTNSRDQEMQVLGAKTNESQLCPSRK